MVAVLGFDHDTEEELIKIPQYIDYLGLDLCRFAILTPYPGTEFYRNIKSGRIITDDWSRYTQIMLFSAQNSSRGLEEIYMRVWKEAFKWRRVFKRTFHSVWRKAICFCTFRRKYRFKFLELMRNKK